MINPIPRHIKDFMTAHPLVRSKNTSVLEASELMLEEGIRHLPIVDNGKIVGIVSDRSLKQARLFSASMHLTLGDVMTPDPYCVHTSTPLSEVAQTMSDRKIGSAIVLNSEGKIRGIFTSTDALNLLHDFLEHSQKEKAYSPNMEEFLSGNIFI